MQKLEQRNNKDLYPVEEKKRPNTSIPRVIK